MLPVGLLMIEHRLIERMINLMKKEMDKIDKKGSANVFFIDDAVDFLSSYADRCHHGKEENILFFELKQKKLSLEHRNSLDKLIEDHNFARSTTLKLKESKEMYSRGQNSAISDILKYLDILIKFYPEHIKKEDKDFFIPSMNYFSEKVREKMLEYFWEFDRNFIHEKYKDVIERYEKHID